MGRYPDAAVERAMKVQEVIVRAASGQLQWWQAAEILGITDRHLRRLRDKWETEGYDGLFDRRRQRPSPKRVPLGVVEQVLQLYRTQYFDFNVQHFHEKLTTEHGVDLSYSWVKHALQTAGLVVRGRKRGAHRQRRERRPVPGMLLHIDASRHAWVPGDPTLYDLVSISDDATNELYYAGLVAEENTREVLRAVRAVVGTHGVFCALYADRASHFTHTPKPGQPRFPTQVERALRQLGIEPIWAHSPQARGRKERLYRTVQGRWVPELRLAGVTTVAEAHRWLQTTGIAAYNRRFRVRPAQDGSAFVPTTLDLERICTVQHERVVSPANTVQVGRRVLQIGPSRFRCHFVKCRVTVHEHLDDTLSITYGPHLLGRYTAEGHSLGAEAAA